MVSECSLAKCSNEYRLNFPPPPLFTTVWRCACQPGWTFVWKTRLLSLKSPPPIEAKWWQTRPFTSRGCEGSWPLLAVRHFNEWCRNAASRNVATNIGWTACSFGFPPPPLFTTVWRCACQPGWTFVWKTGLLSLKSPPPIEAKWWQMGPFTSRGCEGSWPLLGPGLE